MGDSDVMDWTGAQCVDWAKRKQLNEVVIECIRREDLDGRCLLLLVEGDIRDLRDKYDYGLKISDIKRFWIAVRALQRSNAASLIEIGMDQPHYFQSDGTSSFASRRMSMGSGTLRMPHNSSFHSTLACESQPPQVSCHTQHLPQQQQYGNHQEVGRISPSLSVDGRATSIQPEYFKTFIGLGKCPTFIIINGIYIRTP